MQMTGLSLLLKIGGDEGNDENEPPHLKTTLGTTDAKRKI